MTNKRWIQLIVVVLTLIYFFPSFAATGTTKNVYDDLNRLIQQEYSDGKVLNYEYDEIGNRKTLDIDHLFQGGVILVEFNIGVTTDRIVQIISEKGATIIRSTNLSHNTLYEIGIRNGQVVTDAVAEFSALSEVYHAEPNVFRYPMEPSCPNPPVQILGSGYVYTTIQSAYNEALSGDIIQVRAADIAEFLRINRDITVTVEGGYDCDFTTITGNTSLKGTIQTFPGGGTLMVKNIMLTIAPSVPSEY